MWKCTSITNCFLNRLEWKDPLRLKIFFNFVKKLFVQLWLKRQTSSRLRLIGCISVQAQCERISLAEKLWKKSSSNSIYHNLRSGVFFFHVFFQGRKGIIGRGHDLRLDLLTSKVLPYYLAAGWLPIFQYTVESRVVLFPALNISWHIRIHNWPPFQPLPKSNKTI